MAITPRSIIKNPLLLLVATLSVGAGLWGAYWLFASCSSSCTRTKTKTYKVTKVKTTVKAVERINPGACKYVFEQAPSDLSHWTEKQYVRAVACFQANEDSPQVVRIAERGLENYPASETLYNAKAYHEIELKRYDDAVDTLQTGLARVGTPSSGIMENNLAWAGLWESRRIDNRRARDLYRTSLRRDPTSCEAIHTGLWVEYATAVKSHSEKRKQAIDAYRELRADYSGCERRLNNPEENTIFEVLGAGVLDYEIERLEVRSELERGVVTGRKVKPSRLLSLSVGKAVANYPDMNLNRLCAEASPVRRALHSCRALVRSEIARHRHANIRVLTK